MNTKLTAIVSQYRKILYTDGIVTKEELIEMLKADEEINLTSEEHYERLAEKILFKIIDKIDRERNPEKLSIAERNERRMRLYKKELSDYEIAKIEKTAITTIWHWRNKLELKPNPSKQQRKYIKDSIKRLELYSQGYSDIEIAEKSKTSLTSVREWRKVNNLLANKKDDPKKSINQIKKERRMKMLESGIKPREIAESEGVNIKSIYEWIRRNRENA